MGGASSKSRTKIESDTSLEAINESISVFLTKCINDKPESISNYKDYKKLTSVVRLFLETSEKFTKNFIEPYKKLTESSVVLTDKTVQLKDELEIYIKDLIKLFNETLKTLSISDKVPQFLDVVEHASYYSRVAKIQKLGEELSQFEKEYGLSKEEKTSSSDQSQSSHSSNVSAPVEISNDVKKQVTEKPDNKLDTGFLGVRLEERKQTFV